MHNHLYSNYTSCKFRREVGIFSALNDAALTIPVPGSAMGALNTGV
jgi:hypothetical protein